PPRPGARPRRGRSDGTPIPRTGASARPPPPSLSTRDARAENLERIDAQDELRVARHGTVVLAGEGAGNAGGLFSTFLSDLSAEYDFSLVQSPDEAVRFPAGESAEIAGLEPRKTGLTNGLTSSSAGPMR